MTPACAARPSFTITPSPRTRAPRPTGSMRSRCPAYDRYTGPGPGVVAGRRGARVRVRRGERGVRARGRRAAVTASTSRRSPSRWRAHQPRTSVTGRCASGDERRGDRLPRARVRPHRRRGHPPPPRSRRGAREIARTLKPGGTALFIEPLGHNPAHQLYRRMTPSMRTADEHPLLQSDLASARRHFGEVRAGVLSTCRCWPRCCCVRSPYFGRAAGGVLDGLDRRACSSSRSPLRWGASCDPAHPRGVTRTDEAVWTLLRER